MIDRWKKRIGREADAEQDRRERDEAAVSDDALVAYEKKWSDRLARLQKKYPQRWRVPGLSEEEVRAELTLRLIVAVRTRTPEHAALDRADRPWGLLLMERERRMLLRSFRLHIVLEDAAAMMRDRAPTEEEDLIARQSEEQKKLAIDRAESALTRPQRRWLAAMKMSANAGAFFASSGAPNLSAAARVLDKDRSSATRAFEELARHFTSELEKLDE